MSNNESFEEILRKDGQLVYTNVGNSMAPLIRQNENVLVIKPVQGKLHKFDIPLYRRDDGKYILHRILKVREDDYVICGDNRYRLEKGITDRHIIGVLDQVLDKNGNNILEKGSYKIYRFLWCDLYPIRVSFLWLKALPKRIKRKLGNK